MKIIVRTRLTNLRVSFDFCGIPSSDPDMVAMGILREHTLLNTKIIFKIGPRLTEYSVNIHKKICTVEH